MITIATLVQGTPSASSRVRALLICSSCIGYLSRQPSAYGNPFPLVKGLRLSFGPPPLLKSVCLSDLLLLGKIWLERYMRFLRYGHLYFHP